MRHTLGTLLMVGAMFLWAVKEPQRAWESWLTRLAKYDAQTFYLMHLWVIEALGMVIVRAGLNLPNNRVDKAVCGDGAVGGDKRRVAQVPDDDKGSQARIANAPK